MADILESIILYAVGYTIVAFAMLLWLCQMAWDKGERVILKRWLKREQI